MKDKAIELSKEELKNFLTFDKEHVLIAKRQHPIVLVGPILLSLLLVSVFLLFLYLIATFIFNSLLLFVIFTLVVLVFYFNLIAKIVVDYYFHVYLVTNRKILEVMAIPMFTDKINDVLLDQVRTTEIQVKMPGMFHELFDLGDVYIEFDRPSHEQQFIFDNISYPNVVGSILSKELQSIMQESPVWFQPRHNNFSKYNDDTYKDSKD